MSVSFPGDQPYYKRLRAILQAAPTREHLLDAIVNAPFHELRRSVHLDLGMVVLLLVDAAKGTVNRIALSSTPAANGAARISDTLFADIKIPLAHKRNVIAQAIRSGEPQVTADWELLFVPALSAQAARFNQAGAGIESSHVYPLRDAGQDGALVFNFFQPASNIGPEHQAFVQLYGGMVADALRASTAAA
ncbi:MAG TPA: hypothetical protein VLF71_02750 [Candidatus Saccharimonadales bacterium]|nr:hypothetical protein [Candidatus Saccharimonadales bacterium]